MDEIENKIYHKNDYSGAIIDLKNILKKDSKNPQIYYNLALCYLVIDEYKLALENYNLFFKLTAKDNYMIEVAYLGRGEAKYHLGDYIGSVKDLDKSINYDLDDPTAYLPRGQSLAKLGMMESACDDFEKYILAYPEIIEKNGQFSVRNFDFTSKESIKELSILYKECNCEELKKIKGAF